MSGCDDFSKLFFLILFSCSVLTHNARLCDFIFLNKCENWLSSTGVRTAMIYGEITQKFNGDLNVGPSQSKSPYIHYYMAFCHQNK